MRPPLPSQLAVAKYQQLGRPIYCGGGNGPYIAFTFDDGPGPLTPQLLQLLRAQHVPGTFFLIGRNVAANPALARALMSVGAIGDHTWDHPQLPQLAAPAIDQEVRAARDFIDATLGHPITLFRPPFGQHNPTIDSIVQSLGLLEVEWSVSGDDAGAASIYDTLVSNVQAGSIVLLHENNPGEIEALQQFLPVMRQRGLIPVTVPMLLALDPPDTVDPPNNRGQCVAHWVQGHRATRLGAPLLARPR